MYEYNGARVFFLNNDNESHAYIRYIFKGGSSFDSDFKYGVAHLIEHLVQSVRYKDKGTIVQVTELCGGEYKAVTTRDRTEYTVKILPQYAEEIAEVSNNVFSNLYKFDLNIETINKEKQVVKKEMNLKNNDLSWCLEEVLFKSLFNEEVYGHSILGTMETLEAINKEAIESYIKANYVPSNLIVVVYGKFHKEKIQLIFKRSLYKEYKDKNKYVNNYVDFKIRSLDKVRVIDGLNEEGFCIGYITNGEVDKKFIYLYLLVSILNKNLPREVKLKLILNDKKCLLIFKVKNIVSIEQWKGELDKALYHCKLDEEIKETIELIKEDFNYRNLKKDELISLFTRQLLIEESLDEELFFSDLYNDFICLNNTKLDCIKKYIDYHLNKIKSQNPTILVYGLDKEELDKKKKCISEQLDDLVKHEDLMIKVLKPKEVSTYMEIDKNVINGIKVIINKKKLMGKVLLSMSIGDGVRQETLGTIGLNNLLCRYITGRYKNMKTNEVISIECSMDMDETLVNCEFSLENLRESLELVFSIVFNARFNLEKIKSVSNKIVKNIESEAKNNAFYMIQRKLRENLFLNSNYGYDLNGNEGVLGNLTLKNIEEYYNKNFKRVGAIVLTGDVECYEVKECLEILINKYSLIKYIKSIEERQYEKLEKFNESKSIISNNNKIDQGFIGIGCRGVSLMNESKYPLHVIWSILGGMEGRLFNKIRNNEGLAYSVTAFSREFLKDGYFLAYIACDIKDSQRVKELAENEMLSLPKANLSKDELLRAKMKLISQNTEIMNNLKHVTKSMARYEHLNNDYEEIFKYCSNIEKVQESHILDVGEQLFSKNSLIEVMIK